MTPLSALLHAATDKERKRLSVLCGIPLNYLYQLAGCHRSSPSVARAFAIEDASRTLHRETDGRLPVVTAREIASMCAVAAFV